MSAADKIASARALIEPLTGHTPGPWVAVDETVVWTAIYEPVETTYDIGYPVAEARRLKGLHLPAHPAGEPEANARLIAAAPALRDTVAALADLADAQAQENAKLKMIIARMDGAAPVADKTCDQPGITLSEAVQRQWPELRVGSGP